MFRWHPEARLFDGAGRQVLAGDSGSQVIAPRPSADAIVQAIAAGQFRIGGEGSAPESGFETLTSGSSGTPRRIRRSHASWLASFAVNAGLFGIGPGLRVAVLGQLVQSLALYGALETLHLGGALHLLDDLRPDRQRQALAKRSVQLLYASPAQPRLLVEAGGDKLLSLRSILIGGSKLDDALRAGILAMAPQVSVYEFYGAAETSFITLAGGDSPQASVGRPYPGVEVQVCGPDGQPLKDGAIGEIWVKSPYLFEGYAGLDQGSAIWRAGWLSVGEMGCLKAGHLYLSGRAGRMITVADQNVFPEEIEQFLLSLPGVTQGAVVPRRDALRGHHLVAVLQGDAAFEAAILRAARGHLGPLKAPKAVIWRTNWPVLASGKTDLRRLMAEHGS